MMFPGCYNAHDAGMLSHVVACPGLKPRAGFFIPVGQTLRAGGGRRRRCPTSTTTPLAARSPTRSLPLSRKTPTPKSRRPSSLSPAVAQIGRVRGVPRGTLNREIPVPIEADRILRALHRTARLPAKRAPWRNGAAAKQQRQGQKQDRCHMDTRQATLRTMYLLVSPPIVSTCTR